MLYLICILQICTYLFLAPLFRWLASDSIVYYPIVSVSFLFSFIFGGLLVSKKSASKIVSKVSFRKYSEYVLLIFSFTYCYISLRYDLYNRRIGTEVAAELFAAIPPLELIIFRTYEVILPFVLALGLINYHARKKKNVLTSFRFGSQAVVFSVLVSFLLSGALNSRSQLFFLIFIVFIIAQNTIPSASFRRYLKTGFIVGCIFLVGVTLNRLAYTEQDFSIDYFLDQFVTRLDGLDVVSSLISDYGISWTGINISVLAFPLVSMIPFLPEALELKATALTTVKSNILLIEYNSMQRDINSFLVLDVYYTSGLTGVIVAGFLIGFGAKWVDKGVLKSGGKIILAFASSIACNVVFMEREFIGIVIGIVRDFMIILVFSQILIRRVEITRSPGCLPRS